MLLGLDWTWFAAALLGGMLLDAALGEVSRFHPLVGFGRLASALERRLNRAGPAAQFTRGLLAWSLAVLPGVALAA